MSLSAAERRALNVIVESPRGFVSGGNRYAPSTVPTMTLAGLLRRGYVEEVPSALHRLYAITRDGHEALAADDRLRAEGT